jgi:ribonuclease P protein component
MLPRRLRLSRTSLEGFRPDGRAKSPHFSVSISRQSPGGAIVISKKVARLSIARHLLKRRISAVIRPYLEKGAGIMVYANAGSATLPFEAIKSELETLLNGMLSR